MLSEQDLKNFQTEIAKISKDDSLSSVRPATGNVTLNVDSSAEPFINTLQKYFTAPFLNLVLYYIAKMNEGKKDNYYTLESFFLRHKYGKYLIFILDGICTLIILIVVFLVVARGLGIVNF